METRLKLIEDFERKIGCTLPDDYRDYLVAGPVPKWQGEWTPENPATEVLHSFYDVGRGDYTDLSSAWDDRDDLPDWFLEITEVYDGVKFGIGLNGPYRGRVYMYTWDDGEESLQAESFREFLEQLREDERRFKEKLG